MDYKYDVFISYSRKDTEVADKISQAFDKVGITYFIDRQGVGGGMEFPAVLAKAIRESKVFLFLASKNSYESKFTQSEIVYAFNKKQKQDIIPYIIDGSRMPEELEFTFSAINWRRIEQHPIEKTLIDDVLFKVGRQNPKYGVQEKSGMENVKINLCRIFRKYYRYWDSNFTGKHFAKIILGVSLVLWGLVFVLNKTTFIYDHHQVIENILLLLLFITFCFVVIGYIRPASICLQKRKEVSLFYLSSLILVFVAFGEMPDDTLIPNKEQESNDTIKNENVCMPVDLALTSGTLWGDRNVGANSSSDYGDLYAWGEIETKKDYSQGMYDAGSKPKNVILSADHDVATKIFGEEWSLPTEKQFEELLQECQWTWKSVDGHWGYEIRGKNGNTIFLPAAGWICSTNVDYRDKYGYYWSAERAPLNQQFARSLQFPKNGKGIVGNGYLYYGRSIRAVFSNVAVAE